MCAMAISDKVDETTFCEALFDPGSGTPVGLVGPDGETAPKRFSVYRNNVVVSLCDALGETFPAIKNLLGEDYFNALARAFVTTHPPKSPVLLHYGSEFADFVESFPPLATYPYLADVARLEWAWLQAYHAADQVPLDPARLSSVDDQSVGAVRFRKHPAAHVVTSRWPVWDLARANRFDPNAEIQIDLKLAQSVLITRPELSVDMLLLRPGADNFVGSLFEGAMLAEGAEAAQTAAENFSLSDCLSDCLSTGAFADLDVA
ncbi:hypothetical protein FIV00_05970 [Labrenzia sp. THAF82]|uniref:HvfC/BufC N-terminal domain-containing protein n=1 Tax=Labrenzia sp. THAF82 TaxID=2587861 RepID=UPI0012681322|nr:DNA-binding domain-containing protein [Labrenzia sp. THAF82]QFT30010.1 hypothetical protein FIV00_05970 [Labrenzia sp. THAF82]